MMKLIKPYSVALYGAEQCTLYNRNEIDKWIDTSLQSSDFIPDSSQLILLQKALSLSECKVTSRVVILIPDHWLSVSNHVLDPLTPSSLLPLAALSYAVESTFSAPETVLFSFRKALLEDKRIQLTVFACSEEWRKQLSSPFQSKNVSCLIVPISLWQSTKPSLRSWSALSKYALSSYQPDYKKRQHMKRLWLCLLLFSVSIHCIAYGYFLSLEQRIHQSLTDRQVLLERQSAWASHQEPNDFVLSTLRLMQALPTSVRLVSFDGQNQQADFQLTLMQEEFEPLLARWQQRFPNWRWQVSELHQTSNDVLSPFESSKEVLDVFISVFESE
ncbi:hypothetical protein ACMUMQ_08935 [Marinomonas sp. 2405UD66-6]|uniref:hypothetical protein n=1 Tax=Marinomonas sp. 2405UD66-6 TaxID=3391834 RepID=UPI0039C94F4E